MRGRFGRYRLRTTHMEEARAFYARLLGVHAEITELPAAARARGAPAHWLGEIEVADVEEVTTRIVAAGGTRLGPGVVRDPGGAVLGLTTSGMGADPVAWRVLHAPDERRALAEYAAWFGWRSAAGSIVTDDRFEAFAYADGDAVGFISNAARSLPTHPHWLFFFAVADLEAARAVVVAGGGEAFAEVEVPGVGRLIACHDPWGAAFGLAGR